MFLHLSVILFTGCGDVGGGLPPSRDTSWTETLSGGQMKILAVFKKPTDVPCKKFIVPEAKSASVASGYKVFMLRIARRDIITSFNVFLKALQNKTKFSW